MAQWLVRRRLWRRAEPNNSLNLRVPKYLRSVWPALIIFIGFTWLELGAGITVDPYATASIALLMVVMATVSMAVYQRKAFCRYFCPIGRTIGFYSQLSILELRPIDNEVCANCQTLECYHGSEDVESCPTGLMMGSLQQNTYCTSCGNCSRSCPDENVSWRLRSPSVEAVQSARPHWDEACFMIALLALTSFHGLTMMPFWEDWISQLARAIGDSGQLLWSFSVGIALCIMIVSAFYAALVFITQKLFITTQSFKQIFSSFAFVALPLAFAYHMAHNLNHLIREGAGLTDVFLNPLGIDTEPLTMMEKHMRHSDMLMSQTTLFVLQSIFMLAGFIIAIKIIRYRSSSIINNEASGAGWRMLPMILFATGMTVAHLWLMMQPMVMRM
jgi:ferredoxin